MRFRTRLALFLATVIVAVQLLTALALYTTMRNALIEQLKSELDAAGATAQRQLVDIGQRVADSVRVLSLDYALRVAIAESDRDTILSALRNHGRRVGATRMLLIGLDGQVTADTSAPDAPPGDVPFPSLLERATDTSGGATAVVALGDGAYWMVVVPVLAPVPIAFIAAGIPLDDALMKQLQELSSLPYDLELAIGRADGAWSVVARSDTELALGASLLQPEQRPQELPDIITVAGRDYVALARPLDTAQQSAPVIALLAYPIDRALSAYQPLVVALIALLAVGLLAALAGAVAIAGRVSRPLEALASVARRIEGGDYSPPEVTERDGEIGKLASALGSMALAIGEREETIREQARYDRLTGLPNRPAVEAIIKQHLAAAPERAALLMVGLGRLSDIIKTVGHEIGDRLTFAAATRLRNAAPDNLVARVGDSNFAVWLPDADESGARAVATSIAARLLRRYEETDIAVDMAGSVGIALYPAHGEDAGVLLRRAEVALFAAHKSPRRLSVYDPTADPHRSDRLSLMSDLREALDRGDLALHFQPKLNLASRRILGAEALVRWRHPTRGNIPPDHFINLAEETGNIGRLTDWALRAGCVQAAEWDARELGIRLAINLSVHDLGDRALPRRVTDLLDRHLLQPETIALEITESAIMGEPDTAISVLRELADSGIDLAIDDFGVGQSSFSYLRRLPVRELKIDKAFVLNLSRSPEDRTIVRSIVDLGHHMGYRVTAEGVEDEDALDFLSEIGCDYGQGYYIARALPPHAFDAALRDPRWRAPQERLRQ